MGNCGITRKYRRSGGLVRCKSTSGTFILRHSLIGRELRAFGLIGKIEPDGYPLRVTYFLTERGEKLLRAVRIMQDIGVEYMLENGQAGILERKGIIPAAEGIPTKK